MSDLIEKIDAALALDENGIRRCPFCNNSAKTWIERLQDSQKQPDKSAINIEQGWQPIETAPKDGTIILVTSSDNPKNTLTVFYGIDQWKSAPVRGNITHWMPIPKLPGQSLPENF